MAAIFQGVRAAATLSSSPSNSFDSKFLLSPRRSFSVRKGASFVVVRSNGSLNLDLNPKGRSAQQLIANAVPTEADSSAASSSSKPGQELLLFEALQEGLEEEMERYPRVCIMGEDVGHYGGAFKVTKGLATNIGDLRVLDTPIAKNSFTGTGIGAAMTGLTPVIEGMYMGFLHLAFNQISNNCGMLHYTSGCQFTVPIVIR
ncbi:hypothetical protein CRYUN_Cryun37aG0082300 [Craigia yunnanensis]